MIRTFNFAMRKPQPSAHGDNRRGSLTALYFIAQEMRNEIEQLTHSKELTDSQLIAALGVLPGNQVKSAARRAREKVFALDPIEKTAMFQKALSVMDTN